MENKFRRDPDCDRKGMSWLERAAYAYLAKLSYVRDSRKICSEFEDHPLNPVAAISKMLKKDPVKPFEALGEKEGIDAVIKECIKEEIVRLKSALQTAKDYRKEMKQTLDEKDKKLDAIEKELKDETLSEVDRAAKVKLMIEVRAEMGGIELELDGNEEEISEIEEDINAADMVLSANMVLSAENLNKFTFDFEDLAMDEEDREEEERGVSARLHPV